MNANYLSAILYVAHCMLILSGGAIVIIKKEKSQSGKRELFLNYFLSTFLEIVQFVKKGCETIGESLLTYLLNSCVETPEQHQQSYLNLN